MSALITILFVVVFMLLPLYTRFKKTVAEQEEHHGAQTIVDNDDSEFDGGFQMPSFEYEVEGAETQPAKARPATAPSQGRQETPAAEEAKPVGFDLRQAIIAQTILNAPYIRESNQ